MIDSPTDSTSSDEPILKLRTSWFHYFIMSIFIGICVWMIADEVFGKQNPNTTGISIGIGLLVIFLFFTIIAIGHRVEVYEDQISSKSIFGMHRANTNEIEGVRNSLDYIHIYHADNKCIIVPSYLKNFFKLRKHLKKNFPHN
ncbi:MAG: hypothetical protein JJ974_04720 [Phycisphaerales bacterium]|nr:hypothetical protein [Phycisphaerales bacterium]